MCISQCAVVLFFFFKQKTAYEMRIGDWSSDVCSSDLRAVRRRVGRKQRGEAPRRRSRRRGGPAERPVDDAVAEERLQVGQALIPRALEILERETEERVAGEQFRDPGGRVPLRLEVGKPGRDLVAVDAIGASVGLRAFGVDDDRVRHQNGRAAWRERGCQYG